MLYFERLAGHTSYQHVTEISGFLKYLIYGNTVMRYHCFNIVETVGMYIVRTLCPLLKEGEERTF